MSSLSSQIQRVSSEVFNLHERTLKSTRWTFSLMVKTSFKTPSLMLGCLNCRPSWAPDSSFTLMCILMCTLGDNNDRFKILQPYRRPGFGLGLNAVVCSTGILCEHRFKFKSFQRLIQLPANAPMWEIPVRLLASD